MECPVCGSANVTPSHRRGAEKLFRYLIPRAPYRCKDCWSRFRRFENPWKTPASQAGALLAVLLLAGIVALPLWMDPAPSRPDAPDGDAVASLPVPQHRAPQRSFDAPPPDEPAPDAPAPDVGDPAPAPDPSEPAPDLVEPVARPEPEPEPAPPASAADASASPSAPSRPAAEADDFPEPLSGPPPEAPAAGAPDGPADVPETPAPAAAAPESDGAGPEVAGAPDPSGPPSSTDGAEALPPVPEGPRTLREITARSLQKEFEMTVDAAGPVRKSQIFYLADPPKLVVDLPGKWDREVSSPVTVSGELVRRVRIGAHPDFVRLVLDLAVDGPVGHDAVPTAAGFRLRVFPEGGS